MTARARARRDPLEREIATALDPGQFISDRASYSFVSDLELVDAQLASLVGSEPARAAALYEVFLAGCYEKVEELDDSSGSFGTFVGELFSGWVKARQAAGAYVFGRRASRRRVDPDGTIHSKTTMLPREQWGVVIYDHHPAYISWEQFVCNEQRLAANNKNKGGRPPAAGGALLQGIVRCGGCGRAMTTFYSAGKPGYDCGHSRSDEVATPSCRGVMAYVIDEAVTARLLAAVAPDQIQLALTAADTVTDRACRAARAVELRAERARYDAGRAERAFHQCDPDNRLVARTLETRWEAKLRDLADAEAELARHAAAPKPPARDDIEALARDLPRLWNERSTSPRDRKRLLRALINDVTLTSQPDDPAIQIGIHWRSGASDQVTVLRPQAARTLRAASVQQLIRQLGPTHTNLQLADRLNADGHLTASGRPFTEESVRWMRWKHRVTSPSPFGDEEIGVHDLAQRLGVGDHIIYVWIRQGKLHARRIGHRRLAIQLTPDIQAACRKRLNYSPRTRYLNPTTVDGAAK